MKRKRARGATQRTAQWVFASPGRVLALVSAAVLLGLTLLLTTSALAQSVETLVSNTGQPSRDVIGYGDNQSQAFTTGSNSLGYGLTSVGIRIPTREAGAEVTVRVMPNNFRDWPDESDPTKIITLTNPASVSITSTNFFAAPSGTTLEPNTTYHVVVTKPDTQAYGKIRFKKTHTTDEDSVKAAGWSIADHSLWRNTNEFNSWNESTSHRLMIEIKGTIRALDTTAPSLSTAKVGGTRIELTYDEALDEDSVPDTSAFSVTVAGSAATVSSVAISGSTVTLRLTAVVTSGQTVTLSYTVPTGAGATPIQDAAGNDAAALTDQSATYDSELAADLSDDATLSSIGIVVGVLDDKQRVTFTPTFDPEETEYTAVVETFWLEAFVDALSTTEASATTVLILPNGTTQNDFLDSVSISFGLRTTTTFYVMVTAPDGETTKQYTFSIRRGMELTAAGQPEISGIARVGETLTAGIGTIADPEGLPSRFPDDYTLQWVRVDGVTETDIAGDRKSVV